MLDVIRAVALAAVLSAAAPFQSSVAPLSPAVKHQLRAAHEWHTGCPVGFSGLRVLTVTYWGFDGHAHRGQMVVNAAAAGPLAQVFHRIYRLHFRIHHMSLAAAYGPASRQPKDGDVTASFECRDAVPSPCTGGRSTGQWSMHAYGLAVDINPVENPYVGCGQSRDPSARPYFDRSRHRRGMVTPAVLRAFGSIGWGWGGSWSGSTKDYMHFSSTGH
jgi:D-alanyl-D-alanine carboxypeptidase